MMNTSNDSTHFYFVTAPRGDCDAPLAHWMDAMRRACAAELGGDRPDVMSMVCLPDRIMAVIRGADWPGAVPYRPVRLWKTVQPKPLMCSLLPGLTAQRLTSDAMIAERIDHCHFAPVRRGLVNRTEDWADSTARTCDASEMLVA